VAAAVVAVVVEVEAGAAETLPLLATAAGKALALLSTRLQWLPGRWPISNLSLAWLHYGVNTGMEFCKPGLDCMKRPADSPPKRDRLLLYMFFLLARCFEL
jgi:hypothetical protein